MGSLSNGRNDIKETLEEVGIKAVAYDTENILPPCAIVVPDGNYINLPTISQRMNQWNVGISILLIASRGTDKRNADELDDLIEKTVLCLNDKKGIDIDAVSAPQLLQLKKNDYFGSIVSVHHQIKLEGNF